MNRVSIPMIFRKCLFVLALIVIMTPITRGQTVSVGETPETAGHPRNVFQVGDQSVLLQENVVKYLSDGRQYSGFMAYGVSPDRSALGFLSNSYEGSNAFILNAQGDTLANYQLSSMETGDPSLAIFPFSDGRSVVRQNIGRFSFYTPLGDQPRRYSSVTGTEGGEAISRLATNATGGTVVLYNPKVVRNGQNGSRAHLTEEGGRLNTFFRSTDRMIRKLKVSPNGEFIGILTEKEGSSRRMHLYDRHGNQLYVHSFEDPIKDFALADDAGSLMVYSDNRARAFSIPSGDELGSTSFTSNIVTANYFPDNHLILALTGRRNDAEGSIENIGVQAVHLQQREITSTGWSGTLGIHPNITLNLQRESANGYLLVGASKTLRIDVQF